MEEEDNVHIDLLFDLEFNRSLAFICYCGRIKGKGRKDVTWHFTHHAQVLSLFS